MVKAHTPINWQNKPSVNTPINETNLNKMDSTIGILDDRIIAHDTSKLDKSTANTMVKSISFDESTGVFTITLLNGSTTTIDTKLEKLAVNFSYDVETQQIVLELIDGTKQYIDLSALITQYEFTDSDTIGWEVTTDGKVKAKVLDGSITEDMLQPNYLAEIKVETAKSESYMNSAKTSENNASNSANLAKSYAVGGTGTRDGEDTDNAKYYSENAKPVAQTITGTNPTATNSANAPLIYGKIKGYTLQEGTPTPDNPIDIQGLGDGTIEVKTCGKNLFNPEKTIDGQMIWWDTGYPSEVGNYFITDYIEVDPNTTYAVRGFLNSNENWYYDADKIPIQSIGGCDLTTFTTPDNCKYIRLTARYSTKGIQQIELGDTATDLEPYTETTATIPIDTLYEGDYLEVYADGSGKIVQENDTKVFNGSEDWALNQDVVEGLNLYLLPKSSTGITYTPKSAKSNLYLYDKDYREDLTKDRVFYIDLNNVIIRDNTFTSFNEFRTFLGSNNLHIVYKRDEPIETPLTAEQVQAFKKLYTFDNVTNFFCDGEITARYYCNTDSGDTVWMIQETVDGLQKTVKEIPDTYTTQSDFDRIVGGTVRDSGLTNVSYIVPNEISDGSMSFGSYTGGTLVDALREATNQITMFLGTLFEEGDKSVVFENDSVAGTLEVFRHKLSEGTYLLDIKVTITSITETLSGNGPSVDLTLQDIGFEDNIIAIRESECLLASYYPLIVNGSSYCLGGGMVSTENSTKGFYLRFLPHKNTKGSISSNNKSVLSGTMMIKVVEQQL